MDPLNDAIRAHIEACGARFGHVVYRKKDGSIRRLTFQVKAGVKYIKGGEQPAADRKKETHPHQLSVFEVNKGFRTVNLDKVFTVKANGELKRYRQLTEA